VEDCVDYGTAVMVCRLCPMPYITEAVMINTAAYDGIQSCDLTTLVREIIAKSVCTLHWLLPQQKRPPEKAFCLVPVVLPLRWLLVEPVPVALRWLEVLAASLVEEGLVAFLASASLEQPLDANIRTYVHTYIHTFIMRTVKHKGLHPRHGWLLGDRRQHCFRSWKVRHEEIESSVRSDRQG